MNSFCLNESSRSRAQAIIGMFLTTLATPRIRPRTAADSTPTVREPRTPRAIPGIAAITVAATESRAVETVSVRMVGSCSNDAAVGAKLTKSQLKAAGIEPIA